MLWKSECQTLGADGCLNIEDRTLNKKSYAALEGVRGALQKRVNEIYSNLNQDEQTTTKQMFLKLVNIIDTDSGSKAVSRRAYRDEFVGESVEKLLKKFIDENLLVSSSEYSSQEEIQVSDSKRLKQSATVEIAHEILLYSWNQLKNWIEKEKEAIILKNFLASERMQWQKIRLENDNKAKYELLQGSKLEKIIQFRDKNLFNNIGGLTKQEHEFISASIKWRNDLDKVEKDLEKIEAFNTDKQRDILFLARTIPKIIIGVFTGTGLVFFLWQNVVEFSCQLRKNHHYNVLTNSCEMDYMYDRHNSSPYRKNDRYDNEDMKKEMEKLLENL